MGRTSARKWKLRKEEGEIVARHLGPVTELKWCDKRNVTLA
jgi:hypothetical protein